MAYRIDDGGVLTECVQTDTYCRGNNFQVASIIIKFDLGDLAVVYADHD